jgi:hypothetical protein|tara:strand:- start:155 stop:352 length:198 start_codon:yes stop_codon:yes gene_type:complete
MTNNRINKIVVKKSEKHNDKDVDDFKQWILAKANQLGFNLEIQELDIDKDMDARNGVSLCDDCDD